ncbi:TetR/AcrR family transcriptional regulator [Nocardioides anomalus]
MSTRMSADDRRELVLEAATRAFSRGGYAGTSTDAVGKEAGVSQPYVVRIFGTKKALFLDVLRRNCARIRTTFAEVVDAGFDPDDEDDWGRLGLAYTMLLRDRDVLMVLMHGFAAGDDEDIAAVAREGMGSIFATIMATGCAIERAEEFFAQGMMLNVMVSMRAPWHLDDSPELAPLTHCAFGDALELLL